MWGRGEVAGKRVGKRPPERLDIDGRIILKWIFNKCDRGRSLD
jgi:hypothetical protein